MTRTVFPFAAQDVSALARALNRELEAQDCKLGHVQVLNLLARAGGYRNFQHFRAQFDAADQLQRQPEPEPVEVAAAREAEAKAAQASVIDFTRSKMAHFKCPTSIEIRDSLPRTATGKMQKFIMREETTRELGLVAAKTA